MNRNIAKPFMATLSLLDVASDRTHKYKCFHGEDVQLTVKVVGENNKPIDLSNTSVKIYFTLDKNVNEPIYRQDTGIVVDNLGIITVMLEKSYIRIGNNTLKIVLYDEDQTVFLQPLIISCIDPLIGDMADLEIPDDINVRDEIYDIRRIIGDLQDFDDDLGRRLDNSDSKLDTITFDFSEFNYCVKNGKKCNTVLQKLFDEAISKGIKKISIPKSEIILSEMLYVNGSNLEIDFNGSTIIWKGTSRYQENLSDRTDGIINIKGNVKSTRNIKWLTGKSPMKDGNYACKFELDDKTGINVGTYLQLEYYTNTKFSEYPSNSLNPLIEIMTKVIGFDGDYVCVDYYSPFNFSNVTAVTNKCYVIEPIENVSIKNLSVLDTIEPKIPLSERGLGVYPDSNERRTFIGPVVAKHSVNCKFENIYGYNTKFPIVNMTFGYGHICNDIICDRPAIVGSGEGYTCQSVGCMFNKLDNIKCYSGRHVSDFSRSAFCEESNIYGYDMSSNSITLHGECEHDILISNSIGNMSAGHGLKYFPNMDANITYNNVKGMYEPQDTSYVKNIKFINCDIQDSVIRGNQITIDNTTIRNSRGVTESSRKDINEKTYCLINNSEIYSKKNDSLLWILDNIDILNSKIDYDSTIAYRSRNLVRCKSFNFTNNIIKNQKFDVLKKDNDSSS